MRQVVVLADHVKPPPDLSKDSEVLRLQTDEPGQNVRVEVDVFRTKFLHDISPRCEDLLRLAALVYSADTRISRGGPKDAFATNWPRSFRFVVPVSNLEFWNRRSIRNSLAETLNFLTGDEFSFDFVAPNRATKVKQAFFNFEELLDPLPRVDLVVMFSGGTDSLAAAIEAVRDGRRPILVSHRPVAAIDNRQSNLVRLLRERFPDWQFPHISMWVNRKGGSRPTEFTQRSRSFLFTSLGAVTAYFPRVPF